MLIFKKGSYNLRQLTLLYDALEAGKYAICFGNSDGENCDECDANKVCNDLLSTKLYISTLISQATGKYSDYRNQEIKGGE